MKSVKNTTLKTMNQMKVCIFGIHGLVGQKIIEVLNERFFKNKGLSEGDLSPDNIMLVATDKSVENGARSHLIDRFPLTKGLPIIKAIDAIIKKPDIVLMSAGSEASKKWAKQFVEAGSYVIDNSSAWRMDDDISLVIPGVADWGVGGSIQLISNPNCVAIMVATAIAPLIPFDMSVVAVVALQSASGAGAKGLEVLDFEEQMNERLATPNVFPGKLYNNILPASGKFSSELYNEEEEKGIHEIRKIFRKNDFKISFRSLRYPVPYGHVASLRIKFKEIVSLEKIRNALAIGNNIKYQLEPFNLEGDVLGHNECFVFLGGCATIETIIR
ncbi:MAG: Asd/ArgC dimerization domain-containing protein [Candidatus Nomurabacteria bacterium]|nr:Asd/ArgC dimerization domain-containing protein [Candidatus Nomurabacteria bacterium]